MFAPPASATGTRLRRPGGSDLGRRPQMALGVQAAGVVAAVGRDIDEFDAGPPVLVESAPFRDQGAGLSS
jgi:NADPH:quinone reductase-like Zn-dependent oxidoreductase